MYPKLKNKQNVLFYLILLTIINSISSSSNSDSDSDEHSLSSSSSSSSKQSNTNLKTEDTDEVLPKQLFAHYRESYITKEDANKFRQRIQAHKKPYTDRDYDDLIQEMDFKPKKSKKVAADIYDKKYFDYLPADTDNESENVEHHHAKKSAPKKHSKHHQNNKNNKRRNRRDTLALAALESSAAYAATQQFINNERGYYYQVPSNPWTNNYYQNHRPYIVNRQYLPSAPVYVLPPLQPFGEYPSNPPHHNIAHPPVNPPTNTQIVTESPTDTMDIGNRFDMDDEMPVWEMWDVNFPDAIKIVNPSLVQPTRRPPPSILRTTTRQPSPLRTRRPPPPLVRIPNKEFEDNEPQITANVNTVQNSVSANRSPELGPAFQSDNQPRPNQLEDDEQEAGPSRCVWGIVSCCKRGNLAVRYSCFENLGCGGAFWDYNPCTNEILDAALKQTNEHFN